MSDIIRLPYFLVMMGFIYENPKANLNIIAKKMEVTYSHVSKLRGVLVEKGWIKTTITGRSMSIELTPQGKAVAEAYIYLRQVLGGGKKNEVVVGN